MSFVLLILLIVFVLGPLARAAAGRIGAGPGERALPGAAHEVARLREEVDRLSAEVARLAEEQAFTLKLLAPGGEPPTPGPSPASGGGEH